MSALSVNETKLTSTNAFIVNFFTLESKKRPINNERTFFWDYPRGLDLSLNP